MLRDQDQGGIDQLSETSVPEPRQADPPHLADPASVARTEQSIDHVSRLEQMDGGSDIRHRAWFEHADRDLRTVLDALADLGAITRDRGMADPVFLQPDLSGAGPELPADKCRRTRHR